MGKRHNLFGNEDENIHLHRATDTSKRQPLSEQSFNQHPFCAADKTIFRNQYKLAATLFATVVLFVGVSVTVSLNTR
jgi:hypothetical protein